MRRPAALTHALKEAQNHGIAVLLVLGVVGSHIWSLMRFPAPFVDEAWFTSRAWAFLDTGRPFGALDQGVFERFEAPWTVFPYFPTWVQSLALRTVDTPALVPVRVVSLAFGLLLLMAVFSLARAGLDRTAGLIAVLLVGFSGPFLYSAHLARYDILVAALGYSALAVAMTGRSSHFWGGVLSGLLVGLAFETHPNGGLFALASLGVYLGADGIQVARRPRTWGFLLAGGFSLLTYAALHYLPNPGTFVGMSRLVYSATHTPPVLTGSPAILLASFAEIFTALVDAYLAFLPIVLLAPAYLVWQRSEQDRRLLILAGGVLLGSALLIRNKWPYYRILFTPAVDLLVAVFLVQLYRRRFPKPAWRLFSGVLILTLLAITLVLNLIPLRFDASRQFSAVMGRLAGTVQPGDRIMASQTYWFGLYNHSYYSWENLVYHRRYRPEDSLADAFEAFSPDVLIIDGQMTTYIADREGASLYSRYLRLPESELAAYLEKHGRLESRFSGGPYGEIRVFRLP